MKTGLGALSLALLTSMPLSEAIGEPVKFSFSLAPPQTPFLDSSETLQRNAPPSGLHSSKADGTPAVDAPVTGPAQGDLDCSSDEVPAHVSKMVGDFAKDLLTREPKEDVATIIDRLSLMIGAMPGESSYNANDVSDMGKKDAQKSFLAVPGMKLSDHEPKIEINAQTNFGLLQISPDRFHIHPVDSFRALNNVMGARGSDGSPPKQSASSDQFKNESVGKNYFVAARGLYNNFQGASSGDELAARCGLAGFYDTKTGAYKEAVRELAAIGASWGVLGTNQLEVSKLVSSNKSTEPSAAAEYFGRLLIYCPRLNLELAYNEFVNISKKTNKSQAYSYFEGLAKGTVRALCEEGLKKFLAEQAGSKPESNSISSPLSSPGDSGPPDSAPGPAAAAAPGGRPAAPAEPVATVAKLSPGDFAARVDEFKDSDTSDVELPKKASDLLRQAGLTRVKVIDLVDAHAKAAAAYKSAPTPSNRQRLSDAEDGVLELEKVRRKAHDELNRYAVTNGPMGNDLTVAGWQEVAPLINEQIKPGPFATDNPAGKLKKTADSIKADRDARAKAAASFMDPTNREAERRAFESRFVTGYTAKPGTRNSVATYKMSFGPASEQEFKKLCTYAREELTMAQQAQKAAPRQTTQLSDAVNAALAKLRAIESSYGKTCPSS
jgi:hypothetical protein